MGKVVAYDANVSQKVEPSRLTQRVVRERKLYSLVVSMIDDEEYIRPELDGRMTVCVLAFSDGASSLGHYIDAKGTLPDSAAMDRAKRAAIKQRVSYMSKAIGVGAE